MIEHDSALNILIKDTFVLPINTWLTLKFHYIRLMTEAIQGVNEKQDRHQG